MIYISLDIETTGLDPKTCDILEIGAYVEDTDKQLPREKLPCWHRYIWKDNYRGEPYAFMMNAHIFEKILDLKRTGSELVIFPKYASATFADFVFCNVKGNKPVVAGKNVAGFDLPFIQENILNWRVGFKFHHRVIDPGMLYFNPQTDAVPPDLKECKKRAGLPEVVTHEALDDAWDVIQLIRAKYPRVYE